MPRLDLTLFASRTETVGKKQSLSWSCAARWVADAPTFPHKIRCPMFRTGANALDSRANGTSVERWTALVVEHDAETMTLDEGAARLQEAGIAAVMFTSANHMTVSEKSQGGPRWRAILPLDAPVDDHAEYQRLVRVANHVLGGALAPESAEGSRCWFFGRVQGVLYEHQVIDTTACIDSLDELVGLGELELAPRPGAKPAKAPERSAEPDDDRELERQIDLSTVTSKTMVELATAVDVLDFSNRRMWADQAGMALASLKGTDFEEQARAIWVEKSVKSGGYQAGDESQWDTFAPNRVTFKSIFTWADEADPSWRERAKEALQRQVSVEPALELMRREHQARENRLIGEGEVSVPVAEVVTLDQALARFVFLSDGSRVADVLSPHYDLPLADFVTTYSASKMKVPKTRAGKLVLDSEGEPLLEDVPITRAWQASSQRMTVVSRTFRAGGALTLPDPEGRLSLNSWRPYDRSRKVTDADRELAGAFFEHVDYLFDESAPRFLDWLAHIEQEPGVLPHTAWLHIARKQGLGRNWMCSVLTRVWRGKVAANVNLPELLASGYNGQLKGKVFAFVDEIREGARDSQWQHSETVKTLMNCEFRHINPKYGRQFTEFNACRWLLLSNHDSALPLDDTDRRFEVVKSCAEPRGADYYQRLYALLDQPGFIAAVAEALAKRDLGRFNPGDRAQFSAAKRDVVRASRTPVAEWCERVVSHWPADVILSSDLEAVLCGQVGGGLNAMHRRTLEQFDIKPLGRAVKVPVSPGGDEMRPVRVTVLKNFDKWQSADAHVIRAALESVETLKESAELGLSPREFVEHLAAEAAEKCA